MPAFSGLYNGVYGENYAPISKPRPPMSGLLRVAFQKRGLWGYARGFGQKAPASVKGVDADRNDMIVRGGWTWPTRVDDVANKVTITNIGGDVNTLENIPTAFTVDATDKKRVADTKLNRQYVADGSGSPATAPALTERYAP